MIRSRLVRQNTLRRLTRYAASVPNFLCNAAQSFGKEWETVCVSGFTWNQGRQTQNKKRKSYYEKQKKYPDLHRRCTLRPRDLGEFVTSRARTDLPWHAYGQRVLL